MAVILFFLLVINGLYAMKSPRFKKSKDCESPRSGSSSKSTAMTESDRSPVISGLLTPEEVEVAERPHRTGVSPGFRETRKAQQGALKKGDSEVYVIPRLNAEEFPQLSRSGSEGESSLKGFIRRKLPRSKESFSQISSSGLGEDPGGVAFLRKYASKESSPRLITSPEVQGTPRSGVSASPRVLLKEARDRLVILSRLDSSGALSSSCDEVAAVGEEVSTLSLQEVFNERSGCGAERNESSDKGMYSPFNSPKNSFLRRPSANQEELSAFLSCFNKEEEERSREKLLQDYDQFFNKIFATEPAYFRAENGGHEDDIVGLCAGTSEGGGDFYSVGNRGAIKIWQFTNYGVRCVNDLVCVVSSEERYCPREGICSCALYPDNHSFVMGTLDGSVVLHDGRVLLQGLSYPVTTLTTTLIGNKKILVVSGVGGDALWVLTQGGSCIKLDIDDNGHHGLVSVLSSAVGNKFSILYSSGFGKLRLATLCLGHEDSLQLIKNESENLHGEVTALCILSQQLSVICTKHAEVRFWMPQIGSFAAEFRDLGDDIVKKVERSADGNFFLAAGNPGRVFLWDANAAAWSSSSQKLSPRTKGGSKEFLWRHAGGITGLLCLKTQRKGEYLVVSSAQDKTIMTASYYVRSSYTFQDLYSLLAYYFLGSEEYKRKDLPAALFNRIDRLRKYKA